MATTTVKRRYTQANRLEFETYSYFFDLYQEKSDILNAGAQEFNVHSTLWDRPNLIGRIVEIGGDDKGYVKYISGEGIPCNIRDFENRLKEVKAKYKRFCDDRESQGYDRPTVEPPDTLKKRLQLEARLDVYKRELESLQDKLENYQEKEHVKANALMLSYGTLGSGRLFNGDLVEIDYQRCEKINDVLIITEPLSPYYGMRVADYRSHIVEPWCAERHKISRDAQKQFDAERIATGRSSIRVPNSLGVKRVSRESLPKWPKGVKNYLEESE